MLSQVLSTSLRIHVLGILIYSGFLTQGNSATDRTLEHKKLEIFIIVQ